MKTTKKQSGKANLDLRAVAAAAEKRVEAARKRARLAKVQFKRARKALKQAKKAAKEARKQAKATAKALKTKAKTPAKSRAKAGKRVKGRHLATAAVRRQPVSRATAPRPADPERGSQPSAASVAAPPV